MKTSFVTFATAAIMAASAPAFAFEDEMMGTRVNGRMERRDEGFDRVNDPKMDYHDAFFDKPDLTVKGEGEGKTKPAAAPQPPVMNPPVPQGR